MVRFCIILLLLSLRVFADEAAPLRQALKKQAAHKSVVATFRQTKRVPALTDDIKTMGKLWLIPGKAFRWEIGRPVRQTIVYNGGKVLMTDELKKTGERLSPDDRSVKPLFLTLGMGKEASFDEMLKVFTITSTNTAKGRYNATFSPKQRSVKKIIKSLLMQVNLEASFVERIGWIQRDGTETMTEFFTPQLNDAIPTNIFSVNDSAYRWKK
jgi:outer membrane lipoprotein-sorting protein